MNIFQPTKCVLFNAEVALYRQLNYTDDSVIKLNEEYGLRVREITCNVEDPDYSDVRVTIVWISDGFIMFGIVETWLTQHLDYFIIEENILSIPDDFKIALMAEPPEGSTRHEDDEDSPHT